jgi:polynucleotide 5'-hydroxyl-kinase GRC3/NOL9
VLVKGELELLIWGMLDFGGAAGGVAGVEKGKVPYLQWGKGRVLAEAQTSEAELMRKGQM